MKKIILAVCQLGGGGAERVVSRWSTQLVEEGYDVSILVFGRQKNEYQVPSNVKILSIVDDYDDFQKFSYFKRFFRFRKILKKNKPDVLISFLPTMQIWCKLASFGLKFKRIETVRNNPWLIFSSNKFAKKLWLNCFNKADSIIVQTKEQIKFFNKKNSNKCIVIPNPLTNEFLTFDSKKFNNKVRFFIASGRISPQKNYPIMVNAFKKVLSLNPDIKLKIFGKGDEDYVRQVSKIISDQGLTDSIQLCGYSNDIFKEYLTADAFLMTSDYEGLPNSLIEAMASKLVCISTDCETGPKDLIDDKENGFLAKTGDVDSISNCILSATNLTPVEIERIGNNAHKKVVDFCSEEKSYKSLINVIEN